MGLLDVLWGEVEQLEQLLERHVHLGAGLVHSPQETASNVNADVAPCPIQGSSPPLDTSFVVVKIDCPVGGLWLVSWK